MKKQQSTLFTRFSRATSRAAGRPLTFSLAVLLLVVWAATGPVFDYSDSWQLVINTTTTIVTFLMVFLIQNTQYRDAEAMQVKLDELIHKLKGAQDSMVDAENLSDEELDKLRSRYASIAERARNGGRKRRTKKTVVDRR